MARLLLKLINSPQCIYYVIAFHLAAAVFFSVIYYFILPPLEGTPSLGHNSNASFVDSFMGAVYFSITSQTTVGYGDIIPVTAASKIIVIFQVVFGYFYLAFAMAVFTSHSILKSDRFKSILTNKINYTGDIH